MICEKCGGEMIKSKSNEKELCSKCGAVVSSCPIHQLIALKVENGYGASVFIPGKDKGVKIKTSFTGIGKIANELGKSSVYVRKIVYDYKIAKPSGKRISLTDQQKEKLVRIILGKAKKAKGGKNYGV